MTYYCHTVYVVGVGMVEWADTEDRCFALTTIREGAWLIDDYQYACSLQQWILNALGGGESVSLHPAHFSANLSVWEYSIMLMKKRQASPDRGEVKTTLEQVDPWLLKKWPAVAEFLTLSQWEDGTARQRGSLIIFLEDGFLKACLSDRDADLVCFVSSATLQGLLDKADKALQDDNADWRPSSKARAQQGRKRA